jgi:hypothetical protein
MSNSVDFLRYETATGRITGVGCCGDQDLVLQAQPGETVIETYGPINDSTDYILEGEVTAKAPLTATWSKTTVTADDVDEAVLGFLPIPCTVYVDEDLVVVEDGTFEFKTSDPGGYIVIVDEPGFLRREWIIEAE